MKFLRRTVWYIALRLLLLCLLLGMALCVFYYAMNYSNIQIVLKNGMSTRAKVIMGIEEDDSELKKYFQASWLQSDQELLQALSGGSPYADYNVVGIDHRMEMGFMWLWPWESSVKLTITENIPRIDGRAKGSTAEALIAEKGSDALYPPEWPSKSYRVTMIKENNQWKIRMLTEITEP